MDVYCIKQMRGSSRVIFLGSPAMAAAVIANLEELVQRPSSENLRNMRRDCLGIFEAAIAAVDAGRAVRERLTIQDRRLNLNGLKLSLDGIPALRLIAFGKASLSMTGALLEVVNVAEGLVVTPQESGSKWPSVDVIRGGHPHPDEGSLRAGRRALEIADRCGPSDILLVLISGGGSSLMEDTDIPLEDLRALSDSMFQSGMDIVKENVVRKHLSNIKGGRLARAAASRGSKVVGLIVSDVIDDPVSSIASGPTAPDDSTFEEATHVLKDFGLWDNLPASIRERLMMGVAGKVPETPDRRDPVFQKVHNVIVARNAEACAAAAKEAERRGYRPLILSSHLQGEARVVGRVLAAVARSVEDEGYPILPPAALISGGETTVRLRGSGVGGRNQELVLASLSDLDGRNIVLLSGGTDGRDGLTDVAGAIADGESQGRSSDLDVNPLQHLRENDSHTFFRKLGDTVVTGPTGTNVMDIQVVLVGGQKTTG